MYVYLGDNPLECSVCWLGRIGLFSGTVCLLKGNDISEKWKNNVLLCIRGLPFSMYAPRGRRVKSPIHFYCVLHAKRGEGGPDSMYIAYVLNEKPFNAKL